MKNVPVAPLTLVTHQIICVCCEERFVISIDTPKRNKAIRTALWRVPSNQFPTMVMRYAQQTDQRPVIPEVLAEPDQNLEEHAYHEQNRSYFINCPRCGADNRNWLHAKLNPPTFQKPKWIGGGLLLALFVVSTLWLLLKGYSLENTLLLGGLALLAGLLLLFLIPPMWPKARLRKYLREVAVNREHEPRPQTNTAVFVLLLFVFVIPLIVLVFLPGLRWLIENFQQPNLVQRINAVSEENELLEAAYNQGNQPVINSYNSLAAILNEQPQVCETEKINEIKASLEEIRKTNPDFYALALGLLAQVQPTGSTPCRQELITEITQMLAVHSAVGVGGQSCVSPSGFDPSCRPQVVDNIIADIESLRQSTNYQASSSSSRTAILAAVRELALTSNPPFPKAMQIEHNIQTLESVIESMNPSPPPIDPGFLMYWFLVVFLSWLIGLIFGSIAMNERVEMIDPHLPRPIFMNMTHMTRLALWELKKTLEVRGDMQYIQWTQATRNANGGINLVGLHRGLPEFDETGRQRKNTIRAQRYEIETTPWVKIEKAEIKDVEVPLTIDSPLYVISTEVWPRPSYPPPGSSGNGGGASANGSQPPRLPTPPSLPPAAASAIPKGHTTTRTHPPPPFIRLSSAPSSSTAPTSPGLMISENLETYSEAGQLKLVQVRHLTTQICQYFNLNEVYELCDELNLDAENFPQRTRPEMVRALVIYCGRRGLHRDLLQICRQRRPHVEWFIIS